MAELNIVLVEPEIPQNTGNIARTCAATGAKLHLIRPLGFSISEKAVKRAGLDYWDLLDITVYDNLKDFLTKQKVRTTTFLPKHSIFIQIYNIPTAHICCLDVKPQVCLRTYCIITLIQQCVFL